MSTTTVLRAEQVAELSDRQLGLALHRVLAVHVAERFVKPGNPNAVDWALEEMRRRWAASFPDLRERPGWWIRDWGTYWAVGISRPGGGEFPEHFGAVPLVKRESYGRAIFEVALLAAQELSR